MSALEYGIYTLISRPHYDGKLKIWLSYASVSWTDDKFHYHRLNGIEKTFQTEEEALDFGYVAARAWIDEHKSD